MTRMAYFDNAATTFPKPEEVYRAMDAFYRECGVNVGRGQHKLATRAASLVDETRRLLLELNHCPAKRVVFTPSATEALNVVLRGIGIAKGWNVYVSPFEHNAVMRVLHHIGGEYQINIHVLAFDKTAFAYDLHGISEQFVKHRPHVVVVSHASNVCGVIAPIHEICAESKKYCAVNIVDMAQTMGLVNTDLSVESIDYAVFAGHKTLYGPFGVGGFICAADAKPTPLLYGGTGIDSENLDLPDFLPERYEVGSPNIVAIAGLNAALKWMNKTGMENVRAREVSRYERLVDVLRRFDNIKIINQNSAHGQNQHESMNFAKSSVGVMSCVFDGYSANDIGRVLSEHDIAVRTGLHCAPIAHRFLNTFPAGTVRFSVGYLNTDSDFERLEDTLGFIKENG